MKRTLCCILAAIMLTGLCGCAQKQVETKKLWVVTEVSCSDGMNYQAEMIEAYILYYNTQRVQRNLDILTPMEKHTMLLAA